VSTDRQESLADRFVAVMAEVNVIEDGVDNDNPHRHPIRAMRHAAQKAIFDALTTAHDLANAARVLKNEIRDLGAP